MTLTGSTALQFHLAFLGTTWAYNNLPRVAHKVCICKLYASTFCTIIIQEGFFIRVVDALANGIAQFITVFEVQNNCTEGCNSIRPDNAVIIVAGFNNCTGKARNPNAVRPHFWVKLVSVGPLTLTSMERVYLSPK